MNKLSPREISQQAFVGRVNGYDRVQVRAYLSELAHGVEGLLREQRQQQEKIEQLQAELQEKKQAEDEIRRAIVSAERMAHELRENAAREVSSLLEQTQAKAAEVKRAQERRAEEAERQHQRRLAELDAAFRARYAELERDHHDWLVAREREHGERMAELERQFSGRYLDLSGRLSAARQEYAQFLSTYRALLASFGELSLRHTLPEDLGLPAPEQIGGAPSAQPPAPAWMTPEVMGTLPGLPSELAAALLSAAAAPVGGAEFANNFKEVLSHDLPSALNSVTVLDGLPGSVPVYVSDPELLEPPSAAPTLGRHSVGRDAEN